MVSYALSFLILFPQRHNTHGTGSKPTTMKANKLVAHAIPKFLYICNVNKGNTAPRIYLKNTFAASADAPTLDRYQSNSLPMLHFRILESSYAIGRMIKTHQ